MHANLNLVESAVGCCSACGELIGARCVCVCVCGCSPASTGRRLLHAVTGRDGKRERRQQRHRVRDDRAAD